MTEYVDPTSFFDDDPAPATEKLPEMPATSEEAAALAKPSEVSDSNATTEEVVSDQAPDEAGEEASTEGEDGEPDEPAIDPPAMWTEEGKAAFAKADPELQKIILENEKLQNGAVSRAQMEAAEHRKQNAVIGQLVEGLNGHLQKTSDIFDAKWDGISQEDWDQLAYTSPDEHKRLRGEFLAEQSALEEIKAKREEADLIRRNQWIATESQELLTALPELKNPENMKRLVAFAESEGVTQDELSELSAKGFKLIHKLMTATAQLKAKTPVTTTTEAPQAKPALKPSIKPSGLAPKQPNQFTQFAKTHSREDAASLFT